MCWPPAGPGAGLVRLASWAARCSTRAMLAPVHASCMQPSSACSLAPALLCACGCPNGRSGCQCRLPTSLASCTDRMRQVTRAPGMVEAGLCHYWFRRGRFRRGWLRLAGAGLCQAWARRSLIPRGSQGGYQGISLNQASLLGQILALSTDRRLSCWPHERQVVPMLHHVAT